MSECARYSAATLRIMIHCNLCDYCDHISEILVFCFNIVSSYMDYELDSCHKFFLSDGHTD